MSAKNTRATRATRAALAASEVKEVAPVQKIYVSYSAVDGSKIDKTFKTLANASKFAVLMCGDQVDIGRNYAVSYDGVGKVTCEGCNLADLFPAMKEVKPLPVAPINAPIEEVVTLPVATLPVATPDTGVALVQALTTQGAFQPIDDVIAPVATIADPEPVKIIRHMIQPGHYTYLYVGLDGTAHTVTTKKINKTSKESAHWTYTHNGVVYKGDNVAAEYRSRDILQAIADKERAEFTRLAIAAKQVESV